MDFDELLDRMKRPFQLFCVLCHESSRSLDSSKMLEVRFVDYITGVVFIRFPREVKTVMTLQLHCSRFQQGGIERGKGHWLGFAIKDLQADIIATLAECHRENERTCLADKVVKLYSSIPWVDKVSLPEAPRFFNRHRLSFHQTAA